jgi:hypothetical protein
MVSFYPQPDILPVYPPRLQPLNDQPPARYSVKLGTVRSLGVSSIPLKARPRCLGKTGPFVEKRLGEETYLWALGVTRLMELAQTPGPSGRGRSRTLGTVPFGAKDDTAAKLVANLTYISSSLVSCS